MFIAVFWILFNLGAMVGGFITLFTNYDTQPGESNYATDSTFWVFISIMGVGSIMTLFLSNPEEVTRSDGTKIEVDPFPDVKKEIIQILQQFLNPNIWLLMI